MSKNLLTEVWHKKHVYTKQKQGQVTKGQYGVVPLCRDWITKVKDQQELNLLRGVQGRNKGFYKYLNSRRNTRENVGPRLNGKVELLTSYIEKTENVFFPQLLPLKPAYRNPTPLIPEVSWPQPYEGCPTWGYLIVADLGL